MSIYVTVRQSPQYHQMSLEELLFGTATSGGMITSNKGNTKTYKVEKVSNRFKSNVNVFGMVVALANFNRLTEELHERDRLELYTNFYIPKHEGGLSAFMRAAYKTQGRYVECNSGAVHHTVQELLKPLMSQHPATAQAGIYETAKRSVMEYLGQNGFDVSKIDFDSILSSAFRKIDAPVDSLSNALNMLKKIFEDKFHALYHTSAFAYVPGRCTVDAMKRHQENESKWFAKYDLHNFFGSTTPEFVMNMLSMIFPFSEIVHEQSWKQELARALDLAFLNNGLPQGTPISPTLTNIMMIPIDFALANGFRDFHNQRFIYTRYADDFQISSRYGFSYRDVEKYLVDTLASFGAPFTINTKKTRYGSSSGSNWNLGLMLNGENKITLGYKERRRLKAAISSYAMDRKNGVHWDVHELQVLAGQINYHKMIMGEEIDKVVEFLSQKHGVNIPQATKEDLRG